VAGIYCFNMGGNEASTNTGRLHTADALAPGQREMGRGALRCWKSTRR